MSRNLVYQLLDTNTHQDRELTCMLSMPTGFKSSTDGTVGVAVDACLRHGMKVHIHGAGDLDAKDVSKLGHVR